MEELPIGEIVSVVSGIVTTAIVLYKISFLRIAKLELSFSTSIEKLTSSISELDKRLAVNSAIIDQFMTGVCYARDSAKKRNI